MRFYTRPLEQMQISTPEGTRAEHIVYRPEEPNRAPSVYDQPPAFIPKGFHCRLRYRPLREGEEVPPRPAVAPNNNKSSDYDLLKWQAAYGGRSVLSNQAVFTGGNTAGTFQDQLTSLLRD